MVVFRTSNVPSLRITRTKELMSNISTLQLLPIFTAMATGRCIAGYERRISSCSIACDHETKAVVILMALSASRIDIMATLHDRGAYIGLNTIGKIIWACQ